MANQSQGIHQLLQAEKIAAEKIADARRRKARRLVQAKLEADLEVQNYREERETTFSRFEEEKIGSQRKELHKIEVNTKNHLERIEEGVVNNREHLLMQLLTLTIDINPRINPNYFVIKQLDRRSRLL